MMANIALLLIFLPVLTAIVIYVLQPRRSHEIALVMQAVLTVFAVVYALHFQADFSETLIVIGGWEERIGISLLNDRLSLPFVFMSLFLWWMVLIYTYDEHDSSPTFLFFLLFLQGVFMGVLQTNDLFNLFVFLELMTIIVTVLIAFRKIGSSIRAGIYYLLINTAGVLAFLIGVILLYYSFGTLNIAAIGGEMAGHGDYRVIQLSFVLMMTGATVKAALFPLFSWLPKAHGAAPSPISALLSGIIVKAGIYMFIRLNDMFAPAGIEYETFFLIVGLATGFVGAVFAVLQTNIKELLAYSTLAQLGIILVGLVVMDGYSGGLLHVLNHALFKALLFLGAGLIVVVYRTKELAKIRGVAKSMPVTTVMMFIGMLSIAGAPLTNGYVSKSFITGALEGEPLLYYAVFLINVGSVAGFVKLSAIFFGEKKLSYPFSHIHKVLPLVLIAGACMAFGLFHVPLAETLLDVDLAHVSRFTLGGLLEFLVMVAFGALFVRFVLSRGFRTLARVGKFRLAFETANYLLVIYLAVLGVYFVLL